MPQVPCKCYQRNSHFSYFRCRTSPIAGYTPHGCCPPSTTADAEHRWQCLHAGGTKPCQGGRGKGLLAAAEQREGHDEQPRKRGDRPQDGGTLDDPRLFQRLRDNSTFLWAEQQHPTRKPPFPSRGNLDKYSLPRELFIYCILSGGRERSGFFVPCREKHRVSRAGLGSCRRAGQRCSWQLHLGTQPAAPNKIYQ